MTVGLDTGFFIRLLESVPRATQLWGTITGGETVAAISCITLYELEKQGLRGAVDSEAAETLIEELPHLCLVHWLDNPAIMRRAARIAHGNGLAMADALILTSLMEAGAEEVYTTDSDLSAYAAGPRIVML